MLLGGGAMLLFPTACQTQPARQSYQTQQKENQPLITGAEHICCDSCSDFVRVTTSFALGGKRFAGVGNQTSVVGNVHLVDTLLGSGVEVIKIFCPEHGFRGTAAAGAHVDNSTDPKTGRPIISL